MSLIAKFTDHQGKILWGLVIIIVPMFVLWVPSAQQSFSGSEGLSGTAMSMNNKNISADEFMSVRRALSATTRQEDISDWQVCLSIYRTELAKNAGVYVSDKDLGKLIDAQFQKMNQADYVKEVTSLGLSVPQFEESLRNQLITQRFFTLVSRGVISPEGIDDLSAFGTISKNEKYLKWRMQNDLLSIEYIELAQKDEFAAIPAPTKDEASSIYSELLPITTDDDGTTKVLRTEDNKELFAPDTLNMNYVIANEAEIATTITISDDEVKQYYDNNLTDFIDNNEDDDEGMSVIKYKSVEDVKKEIVASLKKNKAFEEGRQRIVDFIAGINENEKLDARTHAKKLNLTWGNIQDVKPSDTEKIDAVFSEASSVLAMIFSQQEPTLNKWFENPTKCKLGYLSIAITSYSAGTPLTIENATSVIDEIHRNKELDKKAINARIAWFTEGKPLSYEVKTIDTAIIKTLLETSPILEHSRSSSVLYGNVFAENIIDQSGVFTGRVGFISSPDKQDGVCRIFKLAKREAASVEAYEKATASKSTEIDGVEVPTPNTEDDSKIAQYMRIDTISTGLNEDLWREANVKNNMPTLRDNAGAAR